MNTGKFLIYGALGVVLAVGLGLGTRYYVEHQDQIALAVRDQLASIGFFALDDSGDIDDDLKDIEDELDDMDEEWEDEFDDFEDNGNGVVTREPTVIINNDEPTPTATAVPTATPAGPADLVVTSIVVTPSPMDPDDHVRITAYITNVGGSTAVGVSGMMENLTNQYLMSVHGPLTVAPGQRFAVWEDDEYPFFAVCDNDGQNVIRFTVDHANEIPESNEDNNAFEVVAPLLGCE